jgi:eukaryotic-like serine/threonine-protein kinase
LNQPSAQRSGVDADLQQQATRVIRNSKERINHSQAESLNAAPPTAGRMDLSNIRPGTVIAERYLVRGEIGRGAFGTVLRASDQVIGEEIALKIINPELVQDEEHVTRFLHEVRYSRKVTHENVIRVYDFIQLDGLYGISMEYFLSRALSEHVRKGMRLHPARALKLVKAITRGIRSAHRVGVMHRDLKPANILVNDNDVLKIVDFGLAAVSSHAGSRLTQTGTLIGTPYYMSPEQGQGLALDHRTDIYSLGVIMYEMFTGSLPYVANNPLTVLYMHARGEKDPPSARNPEILQSLEAVVLKAMAVKPENRYQSADELLGALTEVNVPAPA